MLIVALCLLLGCLLIGIQGTGAYYSDAEVSTTNNFTSWISNLWSQTSQTDFNTGLTNHADTSSSPGNVKIAKSYSSFSVSDTYADESKINSKSNLVVTGGQVMLTSSGSSGTETLRPNAAGTYSQCSRYNAFSNYQAVDEAAADEDNTYVYTSGGATQLDTYNITNHSQGSGTVNSVTVYIRSRASAFGTVAAEVAIRTYNTNYFASYTSPLPTSYTNISATWTKNPNTNNDWTWTEIDALEAGVRHYDLDFTPNPRTTQVYVEVNYTATVYNSPGTLTSTNLLSGLTVTSIDSFDYNASAIPSGTGLRVQFSQNATNWFSSSGTAGAWDTLSQGTNSISLAALGWSGANFYYKMEFTSSGASTPILDQIAVNYSYYLYYASGTIASQVFNTTISGDVWDALCWDMTTPANTNITFEVRASNTLFTKDVASPSWTAVGGSSPVISGLSSGQYKQWRATLTTSDSSITPTLHEVRTYYR